MALAAHDIVGELAIGRNGLVAALFDIAQQLLGALFVVDGDEVVETHDGYLRLTLLGIAHTKHELHHARCHLALTARLVNHEAQRVLPEGGQEDTSKKGIERLERIIIEPSRIKRLDLQIEIMAKNGARQEVDDHDGDEDDDFWSHE